MGEGNFAQTGLRSRETRMEDSENSTTPVVGRPGTRDSLPIEIPTKGKVPTHEENSQLVTEGRYVELFQSNFWLFWRLAVRRARTCPMDVEDLFQEIFLNFIQRAPRWDPTKGRFSTYFQSAAWHWMGRLIHYWCSGKKYCAAQHVRLEHLAPVEAEAIEDPHNLFDEVVDNDVRSILLAAIRQMELRDRIVLINYFFIDKTLEQIGLEDLGVSRERVRQIKLRALNRLRAFPEIWQLRKQFGDLEKAPESKPLELAETLCVASGV